VWWDGKKGNVRTSWLVNCSSRVKREPHLRGMCFSAASVGNLRLGCRAKLACQP
jgi:hypothetical protein